jgi:hypothetical protein
LSEGSIQKIVIEKTTIYYISNRTHIHRHLKTFVPTSNSKYQIFQESGISKKLSSQIMHNYYHKEVITVYSATPAICKSNVEVYLLVQHFNAPDQKLGQAHK